MFFVNTGTSGLTTVLLYRICSNPDLYILIYTVGQIRPCIYSLQCLKRFQPFSHDPTYDISHTKKLCFNMLCSN